MIVPIEVTNSIYNLLKENYSLSEILNMDKYKHYIAYSIINGLLTNYKEDKELLKKIKEFYLNEYRMPNKILIISDNHLGRLYDDEYLNYKKGKKKDIYINEKGLIVAYNYAIKNKISTVLHAGDIIEGNSDRNRYRINHKEQINYLKKIYSLLREVSDIKTFLLLGNHDYNCINYNQLTEQDFNSIENIKVIGVNHTYISMDNRLVKVVHNCSSSKSIEVPEFESEFELYGHSHYFEFNEDIRKIKLSSLTCIREWNDMSFVELQNEQQDFIFKKIDINEKQMGEYRLKKKIIMK